MIFQIIAQRPKGKQVSTKNSTNSTFDDIFFNCRWVEFLATTSANFGRPHSRQAIKKYIKANNNLGATSDAAFNSHINRALAAGEEGGVFERPKGKWSFFFLDLAVAIGFW